MASSPRSSREPSVMKKTNSKTDINRPNIARRLTKQMSVKEVKIGNVVKEGHRNFVNVYAMLKLANYQLSRIYAKELRPIRPEDFKAAHKVTFTTHGTEITPGSKYAFKGKDYAPYAFRCIRDIFQIDPSDFLLSLTDKFVLSELGSPGKSGSFFYFTADYRYIIKTIHKKEKDAFLKFLHKYYEHCRVNRDTLIAKILGMFRIKTKRNKKLHFIVMSNVFPGDRDIHETYDLKGSTAGRELPEEIIKEDPRAVLKDLNWLARGRQLEFGPEKAKLFVDQLERDQKFLAEHNIMDYSLLLGIHDLKIGNKEGIRDKTLGVYEPNPDASLSRQATTASLVMSRQTSLEPTNSPPPSTSGPVKEEVVVEEEPAPPSSTERPPVAGLFYQDDGGFRASGPNDDPMDLIYYIGVIDIFTKYDLAKRVEHFWKGLREDKTQISAIPPLEYGQRFLSFMKQCVRGYTHPKSDTPAATDSSPVAV